MDNIEKLRNSFAEALGIDKEKVEDSLEYNSIPEWDSVAHMKMVAAVESAFDVMLDTEDIIDMSSFEKVKKIVMKYGVVL
ncbi:MAG TPA: acyl carrier protein [Nitrospiraceae bacterium]|nr:acyl carrier protein [Nitrospiraceae bacterium]